MISVFFVVLAVIALSCVSYLFEYLTLNMNNRDIHVVSLYNNYA